MAELIFPLQFKRQYSASLDPDMSFVDSAALSAYLTNPLRYAGQIVACEDKIYILNTARTTWILASNATYNALSDRPTLITGEQTGFVNPRTVRISYNGLTRVISLPVGAVAYNKNVPVTVLATAWSSDPHDGTDGEHWLYYDDTGFHWVNTFPGVNNLLIACVIRDGVNVCVRECHSATRPFDWHEGQHNTIGTYKLETGGDYSDYVLLSTTAANRRPSVSAMLISDECCDTDIAVWLKTSLYTRAALIGTELTITNDNADIINNNGTRPYYNLNGVSTLFPNNKLGVCLQIAIPATEDAACQKQRLVWIQPQQVFDNNASGLTAAKNISSISQVDLAQIGDLVPEMVVVGQAIFEYSSGNFFLKEMNKIWGSRYRQVSASSTGGLTSVTSGEWATGSGTASDPLLHSVLTGYKHIPTGGTTGNIIIYSADGTGVWGDPAAQSWASKWGIVGTTNIYRNSKVKIGDANNPLAPLHITSTGAGINTGIRIDNIGTAGYNGFDFFNTSNASVAIGQFFSCGTAYNSGVLTGSTIGLFTELASNSLTFGTLGATADVIINAGGTELASTVVRFRKGGASYRGMYLQEQGGAPDLLSGYFGVYPTSSDSMLKGKDDAGVEYLLSAFREHTAPNYWNNSYKNTVSLLVGKVGKQFALLQNGYLNGTDSLLAQNTGSYFSQLSMINGRIAFATSETAQTANSTIIGALERFSIEQNGVVKIGGQAPLPLSTTDYDYLQLGIRSSLMAHKSTNGIWITNNLFYDATAPTWKLSDTTKNGTSFCQSTTGFLFARAAATQGTVEVVCDVIFPIGLGIVTQNVIATPGIVPNCSRFFARDVEVSVPLSEAFAMGESTITPTQITGVLPWDSYTLGAADSQQLLASDTFSQVSIGAVDDISSVILPDMADCREITIKNRDNVVTVLKGNSNRITIDGDACAEFKLYPHEVCKLISRESFEWLRVDAQRTSGSFVATIAGFTATVEPEIRWTKNGDIITLSIPAFSGTSSWTAMWFYLPNTISPFDAGGGYDRRSTIGTSLLTNNGVAFNMGSVILDSQYGRVRFFLPSEGIYGDNFMASGIKGLSLSTTVSYSLKGFAI